jgi:N-methylhydantoinase A
MSYRLGVDVGGTFTDLILIDDVSDERWRVKTPSTPSDPSEGVLSGIARICGEASITPAELATVIHGTTVATNAMLESKGARVGLITTQGFRQILHLARSQTPGPLAGWINMTKPPPPASLADTREAHERMNSKGESLVAVDREQITTIVKDLVDSGVESLTISLINSYVSGRHEREIAEVVADLYPEFPVTLSSEVLPEFREYERTLTACMNSYVRPQVASYVDRLESQLETLGLSSDLNILRSDAGVMTPAQTAENPVYAVLSGPAGGVAGALYVASRAGFDNILTFDMGGTSTDVSLCQGGERTIGRETTIGQFRLKVPSVDIHTVGAGGGSIAHVPELTRALRVGPESAGARPGPAAYGLGGEAATVTDANVVIGNLPPRLVGGEMSLDVDRARQAVQSVADALGLSIGAAAAGIIAIANETMAGALRLVSVQRGYDPRDFALVAFGGAGPLHANAVGELMGSFPVIVPPGPGLLCALGDLVADFRNEFSRTLIKVIDSIDRGEAVQLMRQLEEQALSWLESEGASTQARHVTFSADMRYRGQGYEIPLSVDPEEIESEGFLPLTDRFDELHERLYGFGMPGTPTEIVNIRAIALGELPSPELPVGPIGSEDASEAIIDADHRILDGEEERSAPIYDRSLLKPGNVVSGPAIITEFDSTTAILSGFVGRVDELFNILIKPEDQ